MQQAKLPSRIGLQSLLSRGWTNKVIAKRFGVHPSAVAQAKQRYNLRTVDRVDFTPLHLLAHDLGVSRHQLLRAVRAGRVKATRHGRNIGFTEAQELAVKVYTEMVKGGQEC